MKKCILILMCLGFAGCATGYHKTGWTGGYSDMKLQDDIYKVEFKGNAYAGKGRVQDFALLRCAEITLDNGYGYFIILGEDSYTKTGSYTTPVTANTYGTS